MKHLFFLCKALAIAIMLWGCQKDTADDEVKKEDEEEVYQDGVTVNVEVEGIGAKEGLTVTTLFKETSLQGNSASTVVLSSNNYPQLLLVSNPNDEVILMARGVYSENEQVKVNAQSTTLALITMHPLFWSIVGTDYSELVNLVTGASSYQALYNEVAKSIAAGRPLYDTENVALLTATENLIEELLDESYAENTVLIFPEQARRPYLISRARLFRICSAL
ncbi:MAG: hypothetical protein LBL58_16675 [Tannerellaceae bacterium]|jgi:hypothetical protein|nr:hypothetical protein [Tannerellaceae bacterium]